MQLSELIVDHQEALETTPDRIARVNRKDLRQLGAEVATHLFDTIAVPFFCNIVVKEESIARDLEIGLSTHGEIEKRNIVLVNYLGKTYGRNNIPFYEQEFKLRELAGREAQDNCDPRPQIAITYVPAFNWVFKSDDGSRQHMVQHVIGWSGDKESVYESAHTFAVTASGQSYDDVMANQLWVLANGVARLNKMEPLDREKIHSLFPDAYENADQMMDDPVWAISAAGLAYFLEEKLNYYLDPVIRAVAVAK